MTVLELLEILGRTDIKPSYQVAVWIKDPSGAEAVNVSTSVDVDENEGFIAFKLEPDVSSAH